MSSRPSPLWRFLFLLALLSMLAFLFSGCNYKRYVQNSTSDYGSRQKGDPKMIGSRMYGLTTNNPQQHDNKFFEYSNMLSREIASLSGVNASVVMLTDKNAYVAIALSRSGLGTFTVKAQEQDNGGTNDGVYNNDTGSPYWDNSRLVSPYNSFLTINDHNQISEELKQTIAVKIRRLCPRVEEVHISANMDFVNEMVELSKEAWSGHPLKPWLNDFNLLVKYNFAGGKVMPTPVQHLRQLRGEQANIQE